MFFNEAEKGVSNLNAASRWPILDVIEANDYNNFTKRAYIGKAKKLIISKASGNNIDLSHADFFGNGHGCPSVWDQYGVAYGQPSTNILIRNLVVQSMVSAGICIGSEMSAGISNVTSGECHCMERNQEGVRVPVRLHGSEDISLRNLTFRDMPVGTTWRRLYLYLVKNFMVDGLPDRPKGRDVSFFQVINSLWHNPL
ncbi:hypothetical protein IFM89_028796 [Coptis chinensis]|uniref:Polygalacturonase n=1 Tax=Coptis chinensis TaxID=261450 RepID=A0A835GYE7_9MAGN|nr:hypothetical protein IFM89_028796 [Coptis chinensis]